MNTTPAAAAIALVRSSFADSDMTPPNMTEVTSTVVHFTDGGCSWFALAREVKALPAVTTDDGQERSMAYSDWCGSFTGRVESQIPRSAQRAAKDMGIVSRGW
jgi:hypothetical protein